MQSRVDCRRRRVDRMRKRQSPPPERRRRVDEPVEVAAQRSRRNDLRSSPRQTQVGGGKEGRGLMGCFEVK